MTNEIWLSIEDVCSLSNEKTETARRKCKSGVYTSKFEKEGKFYNGYYDFYGIIIIERSFFMQKQEKNSISKKIILI